MLILIPVGIGMKLYSGLLEAIVSDKAAGMIYVVFWSFAAACIWVKKKPIGIVIIVFLVTSILEFSQLYSSPFLEMIRSTFIGHAIIGNAFNWPDFLYYLLGAGIAILWLRKIDRAYLVLR